MKEKLKKFLDRFNRKEKVIVPADWVKGKPIENHVETVSVTVDKPRARGKFRVHGLRQFKRVLAFVMSVVNFLFGLTSISYGAFPVILLFFPTSFILADYVWKTRN